MGLDKKFWKNKNILLTGNTGFKGSWLNMWLNMIGANVTGFGLAPKNDNDLYNLLSLETKNKCYFSDIRNIEKCKKIIKKSDPEIIIHLAAQSLVLDSYSDPVYTYETNVLGTVNLLESSRLCNKLKLIIIVTSDKCYQNIEKDEGYVETDAMGGSDPYSSSKGCAELVTNAYRKSFYEKNGVGVATVRAGNVIGGGDWSNDRLIPDAMKAFFSGQKLLVRNPDSVRPWQHVLDPLYGYLMLCEKLWEKPIEYSDSWNFGPSEENLISVKDILEFIRDLLGNKAIWELDKNEYPHEAKMLLLNSDKSMNLLEWKPKFSWKKSLENTISWYNHYFSNTDDIYRMT